MKWPRKSARDCRGFFYATNRAGGQLLAITKSSSVTRIFATIAIPRVFPRRLRRWARRLASDRLDRPHRQAALAAKGGRVEGERLGTQAAQLIDGAIDHCLIHAAGAGRLPGVGGGAAPLRFGHLRE